MVVNRRDAADGAEAYGSYELPPDEPLEPSRYGDALRRSWPLIALIVAPLTLAVLVVSLSLPKTYRSSAKLVLEPAADPLGSGDAASIERRLATIQVLVTTRDVLASAARRLPGETADTLQDKVKAGVDQNANIVSVVTTDNSAGGAARIANTVANTFLAKRRALQRQQRTRERARLVQAIAQLRGRAGSQNQIQVLRDQLTQLSVSEASTLPELQLAEAAEPPGSAYSPKPVRNTIFAFFGAAFIAALVVLARAQIAPRVTTSRELSRLLDLPVLVEIPHIRRGLGRQPKTLSGAEYEAYQTLHAALKMQLPPTQQQVVLITSTLHGEGKTEVTAGLGLALSQAGLRTWLVSADMRWPRLHELFDVAQAPGLAEVLAGARHSRDGGANSEAVGAAMPSYSAELGAGSLHVLASGRRPPDPAQLLASDALDAFFDDIKRSDYDYVLLDGPPLVGLVDSQVLAQRADGVLIVCRLDRLTPQNAIDLRDLLQRLHVRPLGLIAVGARGAGSSNAYLQG